MHLERDNPVSSEQMQGFDLRSILTISNPNWHGLDKSSPYKTNHHKDMAERGKIKRQPKRTEGKVVCPDIGQY
jgi:hypothetical protein